MSLMPLSRALIDGKTTHADDSLAVEKGPENRKYLTIAARLEKLYGLGDCPPLRRKLYIRIQACAVEHGPDCYEVIRACVASAQSADYPDRYFSTAVASELKSLGYWEKSVDF